MNEEKLQRLRERLSDGFAAYCGITADEVGENFCSLSFETQPQHLNPHGFVHGGMLFTLADSAAGALACSLGREDSGVTQDAVIYYLRPAVGARLSARAQLVRAGRFTALMQVDITDERGRAIARSDVTIFFRDHLPKE